MTASKQTKTSKQAAATPATDPAVTHATVLQRQREAASRALRKRRRAKSGQ